MMKKFISLVVLPLSLTVTGCSAPQKSAGVGALGGGLVGALVTNSPYVIVLASLLGGGVGYAEGIRVQEKLNAYRDDVNRISRQYSASAKNCNRLIAKISVHQAEIKGLKRRIIDVKRQIGKKDKEKDAIQLLVEKQITDMKNSRYFVSEFSNRLNRYPSLRKEQRRLQRQVRQYDNLISSYSRLV